MVYNDVILLTTIFFFLYGGTGNIGRFESNSHKAQQLMQDL